MEQWSREKRYQKLEDVDAKVINDLRERVQASPYRQVFHIQPETGLLNDPNGLIYYQGQYYLSHQWFPLGAVHGLKYWFHYTGKNLVNLKPCGPILKPDTTFDSHGVYSGSAFQFQNQLYYMYTANHRTASWERRSCQMLAKVNSHGDVIKFDTPIISGPPKGYTHHFRDPKVFQREGYLYALIGAQRENLTGTVLMYRTSHPEKPWTFLGEIDSQLKSFGYMWECPDYFQLNGKDILLFCPQGIDSEDNAYQNVYQSGYLVGHLNFETLTFEHESFVELDDGFDFYAPQTFLDEAKRRVLIGWMGLPDTEYPTDDEGWAHCLTVPRILTLESGELKQKPHMDLRKLRQNKETALGYANKFIKQLHPYEGEQYELIIDILENEASAIEFHLRASKHEATVIRYESKTQQVILDRFDSGKLPHPVEGTARVAQLKSELSQLRIFVDTSSIEIFCNEGEKVLSSRIFPSKDANKIKVVTDSGQVYLKLTKYDIKKQIEV
ncbi:sucrose-6-phosphate hydrolase [Staphylococcus agnetis]|uniref:sucrose-6-phosphate hydrolase n=1 Tax=Staphylococcus agnetis TaxID=985762 RepID=UPI000D1A147E|nr:sucrose-6-phosphate hydrolase [Staphylococcus agnetis]MCO4326299.1 sucrose-6-phosphate hydrolase [Staphylococcus agnetis]MCO4357132.1 sucrose-6-phosphate hydrolase [Staphylococcus agnetis]MCO4363170.1 sucrose-6-phosphate hydrolase [Staphylococcus agnetis]MCO4370269.1 sucrose-6-phosphate hydrolase [Staphylococcus agnetis]PTH31332.1 sucrose-6-phosphate hydrolase [Staphylococcus agnetis]